MGSEGIVKLPLQSSGVLVISKVWIFLSAAPRQIIWQDLGVAKIGERKKDHSKGTTALKKSDLSYDWF